VERERVQGKGEGGQIWWQYFIFIYENRTMKPLEIVLRPERRDKRERWRR
jgi:hypothetical protein